MAKVFVLILLVISFFTGCSPVEEKKISGECLYNSDFPLKKEAATWGASSIEKFGEFCNELENSALAVCNDGKLFHNGKKFAFLKKEKITNVYSLMEVFEKKYFYLSDKDNYGVREKYALMLPQDYSCKGEKEKILIGDCEDFAITFVEYGLREKIFEKYKVEILKGRKDKIGHVWVKLTDKKTKKVSFFESGVNSGEKNPAEIYNEGREKIFEYNK